MKNKFQLLAGCCLIFMCAGASAQGANVPSRPINMNPAATSAVPAAAPVVAPTPQVAIPSPPAGLSVQGAPVTAPKAPEKPLQYFDSSKRLTIGDMAELQRKKLAEDFLAKHGYTTVEPAKPPPQIKPKAPPPPPHSVRVKAIYGNAALPSVDLSLNGRVVPIRVGGQTQLGNSTIFVKKAAPGQEGVLLEVPGKMPKGCTEKTKKLKRCTPKKSIVTNLKVGDVLEIPR